MIDFAAARRNMVEGQVRTQDVTNRAVIDALLDVPRERFLPADKTALAYLDYDVPLGDAPTSRRLLKPMVLSKLMQAAAPRPTDRVLDIACGTGYSSALWAQLAGAVTALEDDAALARQAQKTLGSTVTVVTGPLTEGWAKAAPYDIILINGAVELVPKPLFAQLNDGGRLFCVLGRAPGKATLHLRTGDDITARPLFDAAAPLLPGFAKTPEFVF
jgi:protein-L-isoaspartate(D-aspartate) O-methyltransferase